VKYGLPENHGLSTSTVENLVFKQDGQLALSDVQHAAVEAGVGRGESLLVVSPTSTGKTQIGLWAIAKSLEAGTKTVYLVTHRALAKQKFEDFKTLLLDTFMHGEKSSLVIATGDYVEDSEEQTPASPLDAPLLVATYEKYLALLSATGVPKNMANTVIVCDEIQLIGDKHRGQNVEILLTFLRNAGWKQFVGLSAVLTNKDAEDLANWLTDEERKIVEQHLLDGKLDVVFATTTLAAGVNFPLGAAVFAQWHRWNSDQRTYVAIDSADFHNMAGRVGRMGFSHEQGKVIFLAERYQLTAAKQILNIGEFPRKTWCQCVQRVLAIRRKRLL